VRITKAGRRALGDEVASLKALVRQLERPADEEASPAPEPAKPPRRARPPAATKTASAAKWRSVQVVVDMRPRALLAMVGL